jgi:hypothetical protein
LQGLEAQIREAIRDAVNRPSRKPFFWGGWEGYQQLEAIAGVLHTVPEAEETDYLHVLAQRVDRVLAKNRHLAEDLGQAHAQLREIAKCLRYPPSDFDGTNDRSEDQENSDRLNSDRLNSDRLNSDRLNSDRLNSDRLNSDRLNSDRVRREMEALLKSFHPNPRRQPAQAELQRAWHGLWKRWGPDLLHCYDVPGLPPDNLKLEAFFGQLRSHQRRISGRKSTVELRNFGSFQVMFDAATLEELLAQLRDVSPEEYRKQRARLAQAEEPRQGQFRLHRNPEKALRRLIDQHAARRAELAGSPSSATSHTV